MAKRNHYCDFEVENDMNDYKENEAQTWRQATFQSSGDEFRDRFVPNRKPDDVWLIPLNVRPVDILGEEKANLLQIERTTSIRMYYNEDDYQVEMWGRSRENLSQAVHQWNILAENILTKELQERSKRKVKGWAKPVKALTERQQRKFDRREARECEEREYRGFPLEQKSFNEYFIIPNFEIPISRIIGEKEEILHSVRAETKCYMWYEPTYNLIRIVGDSRESVKEARERVKHLYMKIVAFGTIPSITIDHVTTYKGWILHLIEPPYEPHKVRIANPPPWFHLPYDISGAVKLLEPVREGERIPVVGKGGASKELSPNFNFEALSRIHMSNIERIKEALFNALGSIHLLDEEIKTRIRFGHICLTDFPRETLWTIENFNERVLNNPRLKSKFVTFLATEREQLHPLFGVLSICDQQWDGTPFREYKICAVRKSGTESCPCVFEVKFNKVGKIGLWNVTTNEKNILDINMCCLDKDYSWKLDIKTAERLSNDKFSTQGNFVYKLRLSPQGQLIYSDTDDINVVSVCEKIRWKYWWGEHYVVEVTKYTFWKLWKHSANTPDAEIFLEQEPPSSITFGVSFYRKSWEDDLALNKNLNVGETPEWHPCDMLKDTKDLLLEIEKFLDVLQSKCKINM